MIKPDAIFNKVTDISIDFLKKNHIKGVILDVDNTLLNLDEEMLPGAKEWVESLKDNNFKVCIASNSVKKSKLDKVSKELEIKYIRWSLKPLKRGLKRALRITNLQRKEVAEIGDQYFTDVIGAKRMKMFSILTKPISDEKHWINKVKRKIEKFFIKN